MKTLKLIPLLILIAILTACQPTEAPTEPAAQKVATVEVAKQTESAPTQPAAPTPVPPKYPPLVVKSQPQRGEELKLKDAVQIAFDQPMDRASVEAAFAIQPETPGDLIWVSDTALTFTPAAEYQRGQRYKVTLGEAAQSQTGQPLNRAFELPFNTVGYLEVSSTQPANKATEIAPDTTVTVMFNRPVVPLSAIEDQSSLPQPLTFVPPVTGAGEWLNTSIYQFTPDDGFAPATDYTARIAAGLTASDDSVMEDDFIWTFSAATPKVVATWPEDDSVYVSPTSVISVAFNQPMDRGSVEANFALENVHTGQSVSGGFSWASHGLTQPDDPYADNYYYDYDDNSGPEAVGVETMAFTPAAPLDLGATYKATLKDALAKGQDKDSPFILHPSSFSFSVIPSLEIRRTTPRDGAKYVSPYSDLEITFSAPVNPQSVKVGQNILISPQVAYTNVYTYFWDSNTVLNLSFPTDASSAYTVTVKGSIESRYGQPLGEDAAIHWQTSAYEPMAYLHSPGRVGYYSGYTNTMAYVSARNVSGVDFKLYQLPERDFMRLNGDDRWRARDTYSPNSDNLLRAWTIETAPELNRNAIYGTALAEDKGALEPGLYYLSVSVDPDKVYPEAQDLRLPGEGKQILVVSKHNLTFKTGSGQSLAWLTDLQTAEPVGGAKVSFRKEGLYLDDDVTDSQGVAIGQHDDVDAWDTRFAFSRDPFAVAVNDWYDGIERWNYGLSTEDYLQPFAAAFYTDRSIYRPGQTVYWKGILRQDDDAHYTLPARDPVLIIVYDGQGKEILSDEYTLNENGSIHGQIELDEEAALGYYSIEAQYRDEFFNGSFQVAEYRKPEFLVNVSTDKPEYANGDTITLNAEANYFFGGAVINADVRYSILSEDYFFRYDGPGGWYDFTDYDYSRRRSDDYISGFGEVIAEGSASADRQGKFSVEVSADIAERLASQNFTLEVTVTDSDSNQQVSNRVEAPVHKGNFYIGLRPQKYVGQAGKEMPVDVISVDWNSQPVAEQELTLIFYKHNWYSTRVKGEDGHYYWDSVVEDIPVYTTTLNTDAIGQAVATFTPDEGGVYKALAKGVDENGNVVQSSAFMWISGSRYINWRQENNDRIELVTDKKEYQVGDTATILIPHPYSGAVTALVTQERGRIYDFNALTLESNSEQLHIPITEDMLPNMFVSVVLMKGTDQSNPIPGFKVGYAQLPISVKEKEIVITLTPLAPSPSTGGDRGGVYQPGDEVTYQIQAADYAGNPVQAEFSLALVDKAILTLSPDKGPSLLERFWRERGLGIGTAAGLAISADRVNLAIAPEAKGGGGGGFDEAFSVIRGDFKDTAYWLADFETDADGRGSISVTLPDNLTTWVLTARGITQDTLVGDDSVEIVSAKPLLLRPIVPRFFVVGDEAQLKMVAQNNSPEDLEITPYFEAVGAELMDQSASAPVTIKAGDKATFLYPVKVGDAGEAILRFGAKSAGQANSSPYEDAVELTLPIYHNSTPETVGTSGVLEEDGLRLEGIALPQSYDPTQGGLNVTIEASLAAGMRGSLDYLTHYRYECTEQTVSRFLPNVVTHRAAQQLNLDNADLSDNLPALVSEGLQRLYARQHIDGGWGWWSADKSNPFLSAYILLGMVEADRAGFSVEQNVVDDALDHLQKSLRKPKDVASNWQANQQAFILYVLAEAGEGDLGRSVALFDQREKLDIFGRAYLAMTFGLLEPDDNTRVNTLLSDITSEAIVSATGAHWEESQPDYYSMNTDTRSTAIVIAALSRLDPKNPLLPNAVRWLMSVRKADHWETTQEAAWAIIGLTDWMLASGELEGDYAWTVSLNGEKLDEGNVTPQTVEIVTEIRAGIEDLLAEEINRLLIERAPREGEDESAGRLYYTAHLEYYKPVAEVKALDRGIIVARQYTLNEETEEAISEAQVGDIITVKLTIIAPNDLHYVVIEDPFPAGTEGIDRSLATTSIVGERPEFERTDRKNYWGWGWWWFSHTEMRDEKAVLFATYLPRGTYQYTYQIRASLPGEYNVIPSLAQEMYFPEVFGRGDGGVFRITE